MGEREGNPVAFTIAQTRSLPASPVGARVPPVISKGGDT